MRKMQIPGDDGQFYGLFPPPEPAEPRRRRRRSAAVELGDEAGGSFSLRREIRRELSVVTILFLGGWV